MSYCEMPEFFSEAIHKARKDYKCCECGYPIRKGTKYWKCQGKWDGEISSYKQHIECRDACYSFQTGDPDDCVPFGGLRDFLEKAWCSVRFQDKRGYVKNTRSESEKKWRSLMARGIMASRLRDESKISAYNKQHEGRKV